MSLMKNVVLFGTGYVLGARAGRGRYEQISELAGKIWESKPVRKSRATVKDQAADTFHQASAAASAKFAEATDTVKEAVKNRMKDDDEIVVEPEELFPNVPTATSGN